jgi:hypothetical protein
VVVQDLKGMTSLHHAARHNQPAIIQLLVRAGLPVDTKGKHDATFLSKVKGRSFEIWPCHLPLVFYKEFSILGNICAL